MGLMREMGLILHHLFKPVKKDDPKVIHSQASVEEKRVSETTTIRRTVIEEIEVKKQ